MSNLVSKLLINERPLQVLPTLAVAVGLNEAVALQQVHFWLNGAKENDARQKFQDGRWWVYNTYDEWKATNFPFWSTRTIQRTFLGLEKRGLIISAQIEKGRYKRRKWYTIDYNKVGELEKGLLTCQPGTIEQYQSGTFDGHQGGTFFTEITTENTTESKDKDSAATSAADAPTPPPASVDVSQPIPPPKPKQQRPRDPLFEAVCLCVTAKPYDRATKSQLSYSGKLLSELKARAECEVKPPTPEEISQYRKRYAEHTGGLSFPKDAMKFADWFVEIFRTDAPAPTARPARNGRQPLVIAEENKHYDRIDDARDRADDYEERMSEYLRQLEDRRRAANASTDGAA